MAVRDGYVSSPEQRRGPMRKVVVLAAVQAIVLAIAAVVLLGIGSGYV
jgi:hypothetical protein